MGKIIEFEKFYGKMNFLLKRQCVSSIQIFLLDAYPSDDIVYKWHKKPGIKILDPETPQYDLLDYGTEATFDTNDAGK